MTLFCCGVFAQMVLHDNGPMVTHPNQGAGGAHVAQLDTNMHYVYGFRCANLAPTGYRCADDFTVTGGGWVVDSVICYTYQTGSTQTSTITDFDFMIWNGVPNSSTIVYGDSMTNMLDQTSFSGIYKARSFDLLNNQRPIMRVAHKAMNCTLSPGTYFLDFRTAGTLASGPWAPPITILATAVTGDGLQNVGGVWNNVVDSKNGDPQGFPFVIKGTTVGINEINPVHNVSLFPNPMTTSATVAIEFNQAANINDFSFVVYDVVGKEVMRYNNLTSKKFEITRGDLGAGMYLWQVESATGVLKSGKLNVE
jgi:hypothetical protein